MMKLLNVVSIILMFVGLFLMFKGMLLTDAVLIISSILSFFSASALEFYLEKRPTQDCRRVSVAVIRHW